MLQRDLGWLENVGRAKKPAKLPVVFTRKETKAVLSRLDGTKAIMAGLLYGSGLRLMECVRLRVKDLDFEWRQITVRDGSMTMISTHVLNRGGRGVRSPLD